MDKFAIFVSCVAIVVSMTATAFAGAVFFGWRDSPAKDVAAGQKPAAQNIPNEAPTEDPTGTDPETRPTDEDPTIESTDSDPLVTPNAEYKVAYEDVRLTIAPSSCGRDIDLDEPVVNAGENSDFSFPGDSCGVLDMKFKSDDVAIVRSPQSTPEECREAIRLAPAPTVIKPSRDLTVCTVTDGLGTVDAPARRKMVRLIVESIGGGGTLVVSVTAWEIPT